MHPAIEQAIEDCADLGKAAGPAGGRDPRPEIAKLDATPTEAEAFLNELDSATSELTESIDELEQSIDELGDNLDGEAGKQAEKELRSELAALKAEQERLREIIDKVGLIVDELDRLLDEAARAISGIASGVAKPVEKVLDGSDGTEDETKVLAGIADVEDVVDKSAAQTASLRSKLTTLESRTDGEVSRGDGGGVNRGGDGD